MKESPGAVSPAGMAVTVTVEVAELLSLPSLTLGPSATPQQFYVSLGLHDAVQKRMPVLELGYPLLQAGTRLDI